MNEEINKVESIPYEYNVDEEMRMIYTYPTQ